MLRERARLGTPGMHPAPRHLFSLRCERKCCEHSAAAMPERSTKPGLSPPPPTGHEFTNRERR